MRGFPQRGADAENQATGALGPERRLVPEGIGVSDEWHLLFSKAIEDIAFGFVSWFHEAGVWLGFPFPSAGLKPVGSVGNALDGDGVQ